MKFYCSFEIGEEPEKIKKTLILRLSANVLDFTFPIIRSSIYSSTICWLTSDIPSLSKKAFKPIRGSSVNVFYINIHLDITFDNNI
jgi:hypothetical protein